MSENLIAVAEIRYNYNGTDVEEGVNHAKFIDLGEVDFCTKKPLVRVTVWKDGYIVDIRPCRKAFEDKSEDYYEAWWWISRMEDSPYTAGFAWFLIPYTQEALDELAKQRNAIAAKIS